MVVNTTIFITEDIVVITFFGHAKNIYSENDEKRLYELIKKVADAKNIALIRQNLRYESVCLLLNP